MVYLTEQSVSEKYKKEEKSPGQPQPSNLHLNAYRSLPGGQVISSSYFHVFVSIGP